MVTGKGLIASAFFAKHSENNDTVIFASGVSDSGETRGEEFQREIKLLENTLRDNKEKLIVYFSCVLVKSVINPYYKHKRMAEALVKRKSNNYIIFRLPQIIGHGGNRTNIFNFIKSRAGESDDITVYDGTRRSLLDVEDLCGIVDYCIGRVRNTEVIISGIEEMEVYDIVETILGLLGSRSRIKNIKNENNTNHNLENSKIVNSAIESLKIDRDSYVKRKIKRYINEK